MPKYLRGALAEYKDDLSDSLANVVKFQFNPENLTRTIQIQPRETGTQSREDRQAGEQPVEKISLTIHFTAADKRNEKDKVTMKHGVGPQLAALEKMANPQQEGQDTSQQEGSGDAVGNEVSTNGGSDSADASQPTPRQQYPGVVFIWGEKRVLPVIINSMTITEQQFDANLNPIQAQVALGLSVMTITPYTEDETARGAVEYSDNSTTTQAEENQTVDGTGNQPALEQVDI